MYAKIFTSLFDGSMRGQPDLILVFVNLLCHSDQDGIVDRHWRAIADETGLPHDRVMAALTLLESSDTESRSRNDEGRRIVRIDPERDWGWQIVNFQKYRDMRTTEERREYMREYMRKKRNVNTPLTPVSNLTNTDTYANTDKEDKSSPPSSPSKPSSVGKKRKFAVVTPEMTTPAMVQIGRWFHRRETTLWSMDEYKALPPPENMTTEIMAVLDKYYTFKHPCDKDYRRRNIITMLNNWNKEIDKAQRWMDETGGRARLVI